MMHPPVQHASQHLQKREDKQDPADSQLFNGTLSYYKSDKRFGFIRGEDGCSYFFHHSSVSDQDLIATLENRSLNQAKVRFRRGKGARGPFAYNIEVFRTNEEMAKLAFQYADLTEYQKAAMEIRQLLDL